MMTSGGHETHKEVDNPCGLPHGQKGIHTDTERQTLREDDERLCCTS